MTIFSSPFIHRDFDTAVIIVRNAGGFDTVDTIRRRAVTRWEQPEKITEADCSGEGRNVVETNVVEQRPTSRDSRHDSISRVLVDSLGNRF